MSKYAFVECPLRFTFSWTICLKVGIIKHIDFAGVAQLAEQRFRKARAGGSIPLASF